MKKLIFIAVMLISTIASANTIANQMVAVLNSPEVREFLAGIEGVSTFNSIEYLSTSRATFGPANYKLTYELYGRNGTQICRVHVDLNILTLKVMEVGLPKCQKIEN